jgi:flagellar basal body-associated protein FliL
MASIGEEQEIRGLFSELKLADQKNAPGFTAVWHRAQARSLKPRRALNLSFAVATGLLICALGTLALWSMRSQPVAPASASASVSAPAGSFAPRSEKPSTVAGTSEPPEYTRPLIKNRVRRVVSPQHAQEIAGNQQLTKEAKAIASWQSPTSDLLSSPSDGLFKSLPQLNENANEMKSFLPNRENDKEK